MLGVANKREVKHGYVGFLDIFSFGISYLGPLSLDYPFLELLAPFAMSDAWAMRTVITEDSYL